MPKLYYTSSSCGAASFIAAFLAGVSLEVEQVDIKTHKLASGADYYAINVKGNVPALVLDDGVVLNEGAAVLQWIADQAVGAHGVRLAAPNGTTERYLLQAALNYIASEVHTSIGGQFNPTLTDEQRKFLQAGAERRLKFLDTQLIADKPFLVGNSLTVADLYLYIVLTWAAYVKVDLSPFTKVVAYFNKISNLDSIKAAHARIATNPKTTV